MKNKILYLVTCICLLIIWQYFGTNTEPVRLLLSSPTSVLQYFVENRNVLLEATLITSVEAILGFLIATIFSFSMMIISFYNPKFLNFVLPIMITTQIIPLIVLAPFFIIFLGIGLSSKIAMAALMSFFPIYVNFAQGYKSINSNYHELMQIYNADKWTKIRLLYFPLAMPSIMAGLKISATLAVIGAIVAEFNGAETGLGKNLYLASKRLEPELMMCSMILSTLIGLLFFKIIYIIEKKVIKWQ